MPKTWTSRKNVVSSQRQMMKKILLYIIIGMAALMSASYLIGAPKHVGMHIADVPAPLAISDTTSTSHSFSPAVDEELKYYFDRHKVSRWWPPSPQADDWPSASILFSPP